VFVNSMIGKVMEFLFIKAIGSRTVAQSTLMKGGNHYVKDSV